MLVKKITLLLVFLAVLLYWFFHHDWQPAVFNKQLSDITIKSLKVDHINYSITDGKIRPPDQNSAKISQLASFYQWTKEDPLFYSPDLDLIALEKAVDLLDKRQTTFLKTIKQTRHLYPTIFLRQVLKTAQLTNQFLNDPSDNLADQLIVQQRETVKVYTEEVDGLVGVLSNVYQPFDTILLGVATNAAVYLNDLKKMVQNGDDLKRDITHREDCLKEGHCYRPALNFPLPAQFEDQIIDQTDQLIDPTWLFNLSSKQVKDLQNQQLIRGVYQTQTPCFGLNEDLSWPDHLFYLRQNQKSDQAYFDILLATEIYFRSVNANSEVAGDQELLEQGIKYTVVPSDNAYTCPYLGYLAEISTLDLFYQQNKPILGSISFFAPKEVKDLFYATRQDEKELLKDASPSYQQLEYLADEYGYLYRLLVENQSFLWAQNLNSIKDELLKRHLKIKGKLGNINFIFNKATKLVEGASLRAVVKPDKEPILDTNYVYPYRNFYGLYYLPFSPSVWRSKESMQYLLDKTVTGAINLGGGFLSYHQAIEEYPEEEIKKWLVGRGKIVREKFETIKDHLTNP